jgi:hypothetical protein
MLPRYTTHVARLVATAVATATVATSTAGKATAESASLATSLRASAGLQVSFLLSFSAERSRKTYNVPGLTAAVAVTGTTTASTALSGTGGASGGKVSLLAARVARLGLGGGALRVSQSNGYGRQEGTHVTRQVSGLATTVAGSNAGSGASGGNVAGWRYQLDVLFRRKGGRRSVGAFGSGVAVCAMRR